MAHQAGAYLGFCSIKRLGVYIAGFPPELNLPVPIYTPGWRVKGTVPKNTTQCPQPGLEPRLFAFETSALTVRPPHHPPTFYFGYVTNMYDKGSGTALLSRNLGYFWEPRFGKITQTVSKRTRDFAVQLGLNLHARMFHRKYFILKKCLHSYMYTKFSVGLQASEIERTCRKNRQKRPITISQ